MELNLCGFLMAHGNVQTNGDHNSKWRFGAKISSCFFKFCGCAERTPFQPFRLFRLKKTVKKVLESFSWLGMALSAPSRLFKFCGCAERTPFQPFRLFRLKKTVKKVLESFSWIGMALSAPSRLEGQGKANLFKPVFDASKLVRAWAGQCKRPAAVPHRQAVRHVLIILFF